MQFHMLSMCHPLYFTAIEILLNSVISKFCYFGELSFSGFDFFPFRGRLLRQRSHLLTLAK